MAAARRPTSRAATPRPSGPSRPRRSRPPSGRTRPGDAFNRIHWKITARHGEIQVKEFELEQTADAWIFLDLERAVQGGRGDESTVEVAVRAAASIAAKALLENRAVGLTVNGHRQAIVPVDRGSRQHLKIMQLLAAVEGDGTTPLVECLVNGRGPAPAGDDRDRDHASTDPGLGPADRRPAEPRDRLGRRHPRRGRRRPLRPGRARAGPASTSSSPTRPSPSSAPSARGPSATPSPSTSCKVHVLNPGQPLAETLGS